MSRRRVLVYHDESGLPGKDDIFVSGVLILNASTQGVDVENAISRVRRLRDYYNELHFQKMSNLRFEVYGDVLTTVLTDCKFWYRAIVVRKCRLDMSRFSYQPHLAYNFFTRLLIYHSIKNLSGRTYIVSDNKNRIRRDNFLDYLKGQLNVDSMMQGHEYTVRAIETRDSESDDILQVTDLLTGVVKQRYAPAPGPRKTSLRDMITRHRRFQAKVSIWDWRPSDK